MILPRSILFVPGDRPDRFDKAAASGADRVLLDLEDAVAPAHKSSARDAVQAWLKSGRRVLVRINGCDSPWHDDDMHLLDELPGVGVMLPKAEPESMAAVASRIGAGRELYALIESVRGVLGMRGIAATPGVTRLAFGNIDFGVDAGITPGDDEAELAVVRTAFVLESRAAGLPAPVDGVSLGTDTTALLASQVARGRRSGFGGKLCIHPRQVSTVNLAFSPSEQELRWARGVLDAFEASAGAVVAHDGQMIDRPVAERARRILAQS